MAYGNEILAKLEALDIQNEVEAISAEEEERFREMQQLQLVKGKDRNGDYLPKYTDDMEYFGTLEKAMEYQDWKQGISPDKDKPAGVMDFWIDGTFNSSIKAKISGATVDIYSSNKITSDVLRKTDGKAFGINPESAERLWKDYIRPPLLRRITETTGIK